MSHKINMILNKSFLKYTVKCVCHIKTFHVVTANVPGFIEVKLFIQLLLYIIYNMTERDFIRMHKVICEGQIMLLSRVVHTNFCLHLLTLKLFQSNKTFFF